MRYHGRVNYVKCAEWGLSNDQGSLFDLLNEASSWAKTHIIDNEVYYWVSRNKVLDELPVVYKKADTVYRHLKVLQEKGLIVYRKEGVKDLVMLTDKGKTWNSKINTDLNPSKGKGSDLNPSEHGFESENTPKNTDLNPTDKDTNINKDTSNNTNVTETENEVSEADSLVNFWNDNRPAQSAVKVKVWSKVIKTRLKTFSADEIKQAMLSVINSNWHQQNNQVLIKNAIDSDKRCAEAIEKNNSQQRATNYENNQRPNSQHSQQNHFDQLRAEAAAKYGNAAADTNELRTVN